MRFPFYGTPGSWGFPLCEIPSLRSPFQGNSCQKDFPPMGLPVYEAPSLTIPWDRLPWNLLHEAPFLRCFLSMGLSVHEAPSFITILPWGFPSYEVYSYSINYPLKRLLVLVKDFHEALFSKLPFSLFPFSLANMFQRLSFRSGYGPYPHSKSSACSRWYCRPRQLSHRVTDPRRQNRSTSSAWAQCIVPLAGEKKGCILSGDRFSSKCAAWTPLCRGSGKLISG